MAAILASLTLAGCGSFQSATLSYESDGTTLADRHVDAGETLAVEYEACLVPWERYVWLLKCEGQYER
jgi:hypothetical protein